MSLSIDTDSLFGYASDVVSMMMPIVALTAGFALGFGLVGKISSMFSRAL